MKNKKILVLILFFGVTLIQASSKEFHMPESYNQDNSMLRLENGIDFDAQDQRGLTALMNAVLQGNSLAVKNLLKMGAHPDVQDRIGRTALMQSVLHNNFEIAQLLVEQGANIAIKDVWGCAAVHLMDPETWHQHPKTAEEKFNMKELLKLKVSKN